MAVKGILCSYTILMYFLGRSLWHLLITRV